MLKLLFIIKKFQKINQIEEVKTDTFRLKVELIYNGYTSYY